MKLNIFEHVGLTVLILLSSLLHHAVVLAENTAQNDDTTGSGSGTNSGGTTGSMSGNDDWDQNAVYYRNYDDDDGNKGDDYIRYWSEYAVQPKRCVNYNNQDVIMFSMFAQGYKQCSDNPMGTYVIPVSYYLSAYLDQLEQDIADQGVDDWVYPENYVYTACTAVNINNEQHYVQVGCTQGDPLSLSVNVFSDNACSELAKVDGYDSSEIDISDMQIPFKKCKMCVIWADMQDDQIDDMFYENRRKNPPLCSSIWNYKDTCDRKCQRIGRERAVKEGWNSSDKVLLSVLSLFCVGMLVAILKKRQKMSNKETLLEQAAMTAAGLQQAHVVGIFGLSLVIIVIFAALKMKGITWAMMLILNVTLFAYLMKLTVDSGVSNTIVNPDGSITRLDSDDSSVESETSENNRAGSFVPPTAPGVSRNDIPPLS